MLEYWYIERGQLRMHTRHAVSMKHFQILTWRLFLPLNANLAHQIHCKAWFSYAFSRQFIAIFVQEKKQLNNTEQHSPRTYVYEQ